MGMKRKIKVLVVDDSFLFRETIAKGLAKDPVLEVIGTAIDAFDARDKILELRPDVLTLDIEMPRMNGVEFLKKLMSQYPLPVIMVSSATSMVFEALKAGAIDFVEKPDPKTGTDLDHFINKLIIKTKIASIAKIGHSKKNVLGASNFDGIPIGTNKVIIAIGASTGGTEAILSIVRNLPRNSPPILIVQHMPPVFTGLYAQRLNSVCTLEVREAQNLDRVQPGRILIAPGGYHMRLKKSGGVFLVEVYAGEKVNGHSPSVDVLFESVAASAAQDAIGVILTGMGADGAKGLLAMRHKGAKTIGQDEKSSVVYGMPKVAFEIGAVEKTLQLADIPGYICSLLGVN